MRQLKIQKSITNRDTRILQLYLNDVNSVGDVMTPEEEVNLCIRIQAGDEKALEELVKKNLRFVISVAKQFQFGQREQLPDVISAGNIGLMEAAKRFDHTKGFKFISYAVWWIRQSIMQYLSEQSRAIRIPLNKNAMMLKIRKESALLEQELEREPTAYEISERLSKIGKFENIDALEVEKLIQTYTDPASLDAPLSDQSSSSLIDLIEGDSLLDVNRINELQDLKKVMARVIKNRLTPQERLVVENFFGIGMENPKTLDEIGDMIGLTRERVRQIKEKSVKKLRHAHSAKITRQFLG